MAMHADHPPREAACRGAADRAARPRRLRVVKPWHVHSRIMGHPAPPRRVRLSTAKARKRKQPLRAQPHVADGLRLSEIAVRDARRSRP